MSFTSARRPLMGGHPGRASKKDFSLASGVSEGISRRMTVARSTCCEGREGFGGR